MKFFKEVFKDWTSEDWAWFLVGFLAAPAFLYYTGIVAEHLEKQWLEGVYNESLPPHA
jgi:hypothetical protein